MATVCFLKAELILKLKKRCGEKQQPAQNGKTVRPSRPRTTVTKEDFVSADPQVAQSV
jgi:hypothetical protein